MQYIVVSVTSSMLSQQDKKKCNVEPKIGNRSIFLTNHMSATTLSGLNVRKGVRMREGKREKVLFGAGIDNQP